MGRGEKKGGGGNKEKRGGEIVSVKGEKRMRWEQAKSMEKDIGRKRNRWERKKKGGGS